MSRSYGENMKKLFNMQTAVFVLIALLLVSCGYKPSSHIIQHIFADSVYVEVIVDRAEPENAPVVKDEMNRMVYTRFKGRVTTKKEAENQIIISYAGSTFLPLSYKDGYVTRYLATVRVRFDMVTKEGKLTKTISNVVESDIEAGAFNLSALRTEAIRKGLAKSLDEFLAYVSAKGMLKESK